MEWNDNNIRNKLKGYNSAYDPEVFVRVMQGLSSKQEKHPVFLWVFGLGLFALLIMGIVISQTSPTEKFTPTTEIQAANNAPNPLTTAVESHKDLSLTEFKNNKVKNNNKFKATLGVINKSSAKKSVYPRSSSSTSHNANPLFLVDKDLNASQINLINLETESAGNTENNGDNSVVVIDNTPAIVRANEQIYLNPFEVTFNKLSTSQDRELKEPIGCPFDDVKTRRPIFFELYFSHDMPFRSLSNNSTETQDAYITRRNETESPIYSYHFGARFSSYLVGDLALRLGLDYATYQEKFEVQELVSTREVIVRDADGNIISTMIEEGLRDVKHFNKIRSLNIPVCLGLNRKLGPTYLNVHAGASMDIISSHEGIILESAPIPNALSYSSGGTGQMDVFKNDLGLSLIASIGVAVPMKNNLSFVLEPNFKYVLDPINLASYPVEERIFSAGLLTGLQFKF